MNAADPGWDAVAETTQAAKAIAFDGCHKVYLAMDDEQVSQFQMYGYGEDDGSHLIVAASPDVMLTYLRDWYEGSCGLRFVNAVWTNDKDPNAGFVGLIPQGWNEEEYA